MIRAFRSRPLKALWDNGRSAKIASALIDRVARRLGALDVARLPEDVNVPGFNFHKLRGAPQRYSVHVSGPWCITFEWDGDDAVAVDFENYHQAKGKIDMTNIRAGKRSLQPVHPGALLREDVLPALGITVTDAAAKLGISRQSLHAVLAERSSITVEMAVRLGKLCGNGAGLWLRMQQAHDLWNAERNMADVVAAIPTLRPEYVA
jgi:proteic killer suppression protein